MKAIFFCHRKERLDIRKAKEQKLIKKFIERHNIDISKMITTNRLDRLILDVDKKLKMKRQGQKKNMISIIEKLLKEYHQNRRQKKKIEVRTERRKKKVDNNGVMHIGGKKVSSSFIIIYIFVTVLSLSFISGFSSTDFIYSYNS